MVSEVAQDLPQHSDPWHANVFVPEGLRAISINTGGNRLQLLLDIQKCVIYHPLYLIWTSRDCKLRLI
jgi:hypothetical protein